MTKTPTILSPRSAGSCFFLTRNFPCARVGCAHCARAFYISMCRARRVRGPSMPQCTIYYTTEQCPVCSELAAFSLKSDRAAAGGGVCGAVGAPWRRLGPRASR